MFTCVHTCRAYFILLRGTICSPLSLVNRAQVSHNESLHSGANLEAKSKLKICNAAKLKRKSISSSFSHRRDVRIVCCDTISYQRRQFVKTDRRKPKKKKKKRLLLLNVFSRIQLSCESLQEEISKTRGGTFYSVIFFKAVWLFFETTLSR